MMTYNQGIENLQDKCFCCFEKKENLIDETMSGSGNKVKICKECLEGIEKMKVIYRTSGEK